MRAAHPSSPGSTVVDGRISDGGKRRRRLRRFRAAAGARHVTGHVGHVTVLSRWSHDRQSVYTITRGAVRCGVNAAGRRRPPAASADIRLPLDARVPVARFTKYLTRILRLSYDNAKVTIDLRRTSNLQNILRRPQGTIHLQSCNIV